MLNTIAIQGRVVNDLELKYNQNGEGSTLKFTIAVQRDFKNKQTGEYEADFIRCLAFNNTAELISKWSKKGNLITISGKLQTGSYENKEGQKVFTTEVVINNADVFTGNQNQQNNQQNTSPQQFMKNDVEDEDLPF